MPDYDKREELRKLRAHLDENCPGWRDVVGENGRVAERIDVHLELADGTSLDMVLHQKPEDVPEGGEV